MIEVKHLTKKYGDHYAVRDLSFHVEKGKIYGFLGPNGAGKSTTMNMITGYISPTEGQILVDGHDVTEEPEEAKKCIGYLPEIPPLYMDMTPMEYLEFAADLKKIPKKEKEKQIMDAIERTKIKDVKDRLIRNLSKGYKQRVGFAQAILGYPKIIILDEPTVGLDPKQIIEMRELIRSLGKQHTVVLSSHIMQEISAVCDEVLIIAHGQLVALDTPENLSKHVSGSSSIELICKAEDYKVRAALNKVKGILKVQTETIEEDGIACCRAEVLAPMDEDVREQIFYACANAKCPIISMKPTITTLEDVFLKVTEGKTTDNRGLRDHSKVHVDGQLKPRERR